MKFVDDLLAVNPQQIKHTEIERAQVVAIVHCPHAEIYKEVVVVFSDGKSYSYNRKGVSATRMPQSFAFKPKNLNISAQIEVYKCPDCEFVSLRYDRGPGFCGIPDRIVGCMKCEDNEEIPLWGVTTFDLKIEEGEGLE